MSKDEHLCQRSRATLLAEVDRLMREQAQGLVHIEAALPSPNGDPIRISLAVTPETDAFMLVAPLVNDFAPSEGKQAEAQHAFSKLFQLAFPNTNEREKEYLRRVGDTLFECKYDMRVHRASKQIWRSPKAFKLSVLAEANKFQNRRDWRADQPHLADQFADAFRVLASLIYWQPPGQSPSTDPNRALIELRMQMASEEVAQGLRTPGTKFGATSGPGKASPYREDFLESARHRMDHLKTYGITIEGLKAAFHNIDRRRTP